MLLPRELLLLPGELLLPKELLAPAEELERKSIQGTATSFSPPVAEVLEPEVLELELLPVLLLVPELSLKEITAKSIRPEVGLKMASLTVPKVWPEELVTWAPVSWLTRSSFWLIRP